jgi:hypothetical protein
MTLITAAALGCVAATRASDDSLDAVDVRTQVAEPVDKAGSAAGSAPASEERQLPAPGKSPKSPPRSLFRCWQDGRMIFEGRGYGALPQSQVAAELKSSDGATGRVQVLNMYEGLCVLELPK